MLYNNYFVIRLSHYCMVSVYQGRLQSDSAFAARLRTQSSYVQSRNKVQTCRQGRFLIPESWTGCGRKWRKRWRRTKAFSSASTGPTWTAFHADSQSPLETPKAYSSRDCLPRTVILQLHAGIIFDNDGSINSMKSLTFSNHTFWSKLGDRPWFLSRLWEEAWQPSECDVRSGLRSTLPCRLVGGAKQVQNTQRHMRRQPTRRRRPEGATTICCQATGGNAARNGLHHEISFWVRVIGAQ